MNAAPRTICVAFIQGKPKPMTKQQIAELNEKRQKQHSEMYGDYIYIQNKRSSEQGKIISQYEVISIGCRGSLSPIIGYNEEHNCPVIGNDGKQRNEVFFYKSGHHVTIKAI